MTNINTLMLIRELDRRLNDWQEGQAEDIVFDELDALGSKGSTIIEGLEVGLTSVLKTYTDVIVDRVAAEEA
jgi:hypothetical protein